MFLNELVEYLFALLILMQIYGDQQVSVMFLGI